MNYPRLFFIFFVFQTCQSVGPSREVVENRKQLTQILGQENSTFEDVLSGTLSLFKLTTQAYFKSYLTMDQTSDLTNWLVNNERLKQFDAELYQNIGQTLLGVVLRKCQYYKASKGSHKAFIKTVNLGTEIARAGGMLRHHENDKKAVKKIYDTLVARGEQTKAKELEEITKEAPRIPGSENWRPKAKEFEKYESADKAIQKALANNSPPEDVAILAHRYLTAGKLNLSTIQINTLLNLIPWLKTRNALQRFDTELASTSGKITFHLLLAQCSKERGRAKYGTNKESLMSLVEDVIYVLDQGKKPEYPLESETEIYKLFDDLCTHGNENLAKELVTKFALLLNQKPWNLSFSHHKLHNHPHILNRSTWNHSAKRTFLKTVYSRKYR